MHIVKVIALIMLRPDASAPLNPVQNLYIKLKTDKL